MYVFHSDYINKYVNNSRVLAAGTDSLSHEIKTEDIYKDFINDKETLAFINYSAQKNFMMIQANQFLVRLKRRQMVSKNVDIKDFNGLKEKMYSFLKQRFE